MPSPDERSRRWCWSKPFDDPGYLFSPVGPQHGGTHATRGAEFEGEGADGLLVRGFEDADEVVGTHRPVELVYPYAVLLAELIGPVGSLQGVPHVSDTLVGPVDKAYVGGHGHSSFLPLTLRVAHTVTIPGN